VNSNLKRQISSAWGNQVGGNIKDRNRTVFYYIASIGILVTGFSYASVPLYRAFCSATGYGGTTKRVNEDDVSRLIAGMQRDEDRELTVHFEATSSKSLKWRFKPVQNEVVVAPGETALAFYTAENLTDEPIIGVSTYNVIPFDAGKYFNKIQCFCFEEQMLGPREKVDMPVFFFIDPEFADDPQLAKYDDIILSYTFFRASDQEDNPQLKENIERGAGQHGGEGLLALILRNDNDLAENDIASLHETTSETKIKAGDDVTNLTSKPN